MLHYDGQDVAAALQTIQEVGDTELLDQTINDALPDSPLIIKQDDFSPYHYNSEVFYALE